MQKQNSSKGDFLFTPTQIAQASLALFAGINKKRPTFGGAFCV